MRAKVRDRVRARESAICEHLRFLNESARSRTSSAWHAIRLASSARRRLYDLRHRAHAAPADTTRVEGGRTSHGVLEGAPRSSRARRCLFVVRPRTALAQLRMY